MELCAIIRGYVGYTCGCFMSGAYAWSVYIYIHMVVHILRYAVGCYIGVRLKWVENEWFSGFFAPQTCLLDILDTAGQEEYSFMREYYIKHGDGVIIVYDVSDVASFKQAEQIYWWTKRIKGADRVPAVGFINPFLSNNRNLTYLNIRLKCSTH